MQRNRHLTNLLPPSQPLLSLASQTSFTFRSQSNLHFPQPVKPPSSSQHWLLDPHLCHLCQAKYTQSKNSLLTYLCLDNTTLWAKGTEKCPSVVLYPTETAGVVWIILKFIRPIHKETKKASIGLCSHTRTDTQNTHTRTNSNTRARTPLVKPTYTN